MREFLHFFMPEVKRTPFYISLAGVTYPDPSYKINREGRVCVIEYIVSGSGYVEIDGKLHTVSEGMVYFLPIGMKQHYFSDKDTPFTKIFMNVSGRMSSDLPVLYGLMETNFFDGGCVKGIFERIPEILKSDITEEEMQAALQGVLTEILSTLCLQKSREGQNDEAVQLKNYIDQNLGRLVSGKELANVIFRSPDYCQKLFKKEYGMTPYAYQLDRKIMRAKMLLANTQMSVGEIGQSLGYSDLHYFSNIFEAKVGMRPTAYRNK